MAVSYWDKLGWRKQLNEIKIFNNTFMRTTGSKSINETGSIEIDGDDADSVALSTQDFFSVGDLIYSNAKDTTAPDFLGTITAFADTTHFTCAGGTHVALANNDYVFRVDPNLTAETVTPVRTTSLFLDDVSGTVVRSARFDWNVKEDFTVIFNGLVGNNNALGMAGSSSTVQNVTIQGSVNGNVWVDLYTHSDATLNVDGVARAFVYDIDAYGILPYMAIACTGPNADQGAGSDQGGILEMKVAVVPHG